MSEKFLSMEKPELKPVVPLIADAGMVVFPGDVISNLTFSCSKSKSKDFTDNFKNFFCLLKDLGKQKKPIAALAPTDAEQGGIASIISILSINTKETNKDLKVTIALKGIGRCRVLQLFPYGLPHLYLAEIETLPSLKMSREEWNSDEVIAARDEIIGKALAILSFYENAIMATDADSDQVANALDTRNEVSDFIYALEKSDSFDDFFDLISEFIYRREVYYLPAQVRILESKDTRECLSRCSQALDMALTILQSSMTMNLAALVEQRFKFILQKTADIVRGGGGKRSRRGHASGEEMAEEKRKELSAELKVLKHRLEKQVKRFDLAQSLLKKPDAHIVSGNANVTEEVIEVINVSPGRQYKEALTFIDERISEQDKAKRRAAKILSKMRSEFRSPDMPVLGVLLLAGPSGVGKTELGKTMAEYIFGNPEALTYISCVNYQHEADISTLIGSSSGYVGYDDPPVLAQARVDKFDLDYKTRKVAEITAKIQELEGLPAPSRQEERIALIKVTGEINKDIAVLEADMRKDPYSVIIFDEIEKSVSALRNLWLEILQEGRISLKNSDTTFLRNSILVLTTNAAAHLMDQEISGNGKMGFHVQVKEDESVERRVLKIVTEELRKIIPPEVLGRIGYDSVVVCHPLTLGGISGVFDRRLFKWQKHINKTGKPFYLKIDEALKQNLVEESRENNKKSFGARSLIERMNKRIWNDLENIASKDPEEGGIAKGDHILVRRGKDEKIEFVRIKK